MKQEEKQRRKKEKERINTRNKIKSTVANFEAH
jgi:hypothetical protein